MTRRRLRLTVLVLSFLFALAVAEVCLWAFCPLTQKTLSPAGVVVGWDASLPYRSMRGTSVWEADFAASATTAGVNSWDMGLPNIDHQGTQFVRHAVRGWDCGSGFRGRGRAPDSWRNSATMRVLAVGDSFTFGSDVSAPEAWCSVLESTTPGLEVLNGGVPGYGVDQIAMKLDEVGPRYKPQLVLWGLVTDDVFRAGRSWFPRSAMPKPVLRVQGDSWTVVPPRTQAQVLEEAGGWRSRVGLAARAGIDHVMYVSWKRDCAALFRDLVRISKSRVEAYGARLVVVHMPTGGPLLRDDDSIGEELMGACRDLGLEVIDLRTELKTMNLSESELAALTLRPEGRGHYTAKGNAVVAQVVRRRLLELLVASSPAR